jgi:two-component sensor histidine kinase
MQTVSTLLGMEVDKMPSAQARSALTASLQRIQAMASVHDSLYRSERLDRVNLADYTRDLVDTLLQMAICPIDVDLELNDAGSVDLSLAVSLGLTLNELVSNALKHGFDSAVGGNLRVSLASREGHVILEVADDGNGLPAGFDPQGEHGVGMSVVTSIVNHRGGTLRFTSEDGTVWQVELPIALNDS